MRLLGKTVVALAVVCAGVVLAQTKPNFSGTWMDAQGQELHIKQDATSIAIGHPEDAHNPHHSQKFNLDGKPTKQPNIAHPSETDVTQATWDGNRLVLVVNMENGVRHTTVLSLQSDGSLLMEVSAAIPGKPAETMKGTFKKK
jgi:hypothetical protein